MEDEKMEICTEKNSGVYKTVPPIRAFLQKQWLLSTPANTALALHRECLKDSTLVVPMDRVLNSAGIISYCSYENFMPFEFWHNYLP